VPKTRPTPAVWVTVRLLPAPGKLSTTTVRRDLIYLTAVLISTLVALVRCWPGFDVLDIAMLCASAVALAMLGPGWRALQPLAAASAAGHNL